ncbi:MAG: ribosome biogenesis GTPase Der [Chloroflexia bacterium]|nr:ribosome biogenesis GTPase Der [Chloroflexia bacterium]
MPKAILAIVGRPNVGKSTLFNRLLGERQAITEDLPGTTRDRLYGEVLWNARSFIVVDTGGLVISDQEIETLPIAEIVQRTREQALVAIEEADIIIFMVDVLIGLTPGDEEIAQLLRQTEKPVLLAVNKADNQERRLEAVEFYALGLGDPIPITALHGTGVGDLLDEVVRVLPPPEEAESDEEDEDVVRVAIVGRPNVGKSQLLNSLLGQDRAIVSDVPGTTRDALDTPLQWGDQKVVLIDTAGIRRRGKIEVGVERYSVMRAMRAIERADVALLLIDATQGITAQDTHIAGFITAAYKGLVILLNKWDLVPKDHHTFDQYTAYVRNEMRFVDYAPVISTSALSGQRVSRALDTALYVAGERHKRVPTALLNKLLRDAVQDHPPHATQRGRHVRIYYATQADVAPPTFIFFVNNPAWLHYSYGRYLENRIRYIFAYSGVPLKLVFRAREKDR